ncbi:MAG: threonine aldolase [Frankiales bacterium]|jgi:threonine aldolase|nr:threonine aldolase [Frankiales bacterium]
MLVDLRSDTVTRPTPEMRRAMADAEVGDDVYGEDPTINALEQEVAALFGHEAAMFVPSGTMGNQICVRLLVEPGAELLLENDAHIVTYESAAAAVHSGVQTRTLLAARGILDPDVLAEQIRPPAFHVVTTRAVAVEQTHNRGGGAVYPMETLRAIKRVCGETGVALHCDGARIWNAHVASGISLEEYGALFDTLSVCLSKGLGAPVGSVVVSSEQRITDGRTVRSRMGGAMRQAGILAAAGLYAVRNNIDRLADDHARAKLIAEQLADAAPGCVDPAAVETNLVVIDVGTTRHDPSEITTKAGEQGVLIGDVGKRSVRLVTHLDVDDAGAKHAADVLAALLSQGGKAT